MKYNPLGNTGLNVSKISLGTVELGMNYGFPGTDHYHRPDEAEAIRLLHRAVDMGINLFDTHRDYGVSEEIIGRSLSGMKERPYIASKVTLPPDPDYSGVFPPPPDPGLSSTQMRRAILGSIEASLEALRVDTIDVMQVHNTTMECLKSDDIIPSLEEARQQGKIRFIGASAYGEKIPMEVMNLEAFRTLQVPFNVFDQELASNVFPRAVRQGVGIFIRSAFLKGVLTAEIDNVLPQKLTPLREDAQKVLDFVNEDVSSLSQVALRFCLSFDEISSVVIGVRSIVELESNLAVLEDGPYPPEVLEEMRAFSVDDVKLIRPTYWGWT